MSQPCVHAYRDGGSTDVGDDDALWEREIVDRVELQRGRDNRKARIVAVALGDLHLAAGIAPLAGIAHEAEVLLQGRGIDGR